MVLVNSDGKTELSFIYTAAESQHEYYRDKYCELQVEGQSTTYFYVGSDTLQGSINNVRFYFNLSKGCFG